MSAPVERPLVDYLPEWQAARTPAEHRAVCYAAAAQGDLGVAGYLAAHLPARDGDRVERVLQAVCS
mgnify:FL=1